MGRTTHSAGMHVADAGGGTVRRPAPHYSFVSLRSCNTPARSSVSSSRITLLTRCTTSLDTGDSCEQQGQQQQAQQLAHQHGGNSHRRHATRQPKHPAARYLPFAGPRIWAYQLRLARNSDTHTAGKQALVAQGLRSLRHPSCAQHTSMHASTHGCHTVHRVTRTTASMLWQPTRACTHTLPGRSGRQSQCMTAATVCSRHAAHCLPCSSCINMLSHPATSLSSR